jgi:hypothetical protein
LDPIFFFYGRLINLLFAVFMKGLEPVNAFPNINDSAGKIMALSRKEK